MTRADTGTPASFDIAVVGLGILGVRHITAETTDVIQRCSQVFLVDSTFGVEEHIRSLNPKVTSLLHLYRIGQPRLGTYQSMAAAVVSAAIEDAPVCFATYGHPQLYCHPTTLIKRAGKLLGLRVEVLAGVSSLDTLLVDVGYDMSTHGLQIYDATDIVLRQRPLQNDVACVLWQTTTFADPTFQVAVATTERLSRLRDYLLRFYPPEHRVLVVFSSTHPALEPIVAGHRLSQLAEALSTGPQSGTLFIPPVHTRRATDSDLIEVLRQAHQDPS
jgi:precorrin-2 methylase